jgi:hypothetical protein
MRQEEGMMLTVLTTSTRRPRQFALLEGYMARQTRQPDQWIVCGEDLTGYSFSRGQEVIVREPDGPSELHSLCLNCLAALPHVRGRKLVICEDDDWYRPDYLAVMDEALDRAELVGQAPAYYWHVPARRWRNMRNKEHASLAQTGLASSVFEAFRTCLLNKAVGPWVDMMLWAHWPGTLQGSSLILPNPEARPYMVGMKGIPWGLRGAGLGHDPSPGIRDLGLVKLKRWIGPDWKNYYSADHTPLL